MININIIYFYNNLFFFRTFLLINTLTATELHFQATDLHEKILKRKVLACDNVEPFCAKGILSIV